MLEFNVLVLMVWSHLAIPTMDKTMRANHITFRQTKYNQILELWLLLVRTGENQ